MYCKYCGKENIEQAKYCSTCGKSINVNIAKNYSSTKDEEYDKKILNIVLKRIETSYSIWIVIGIFQLVIGVCTACFGYGIGTIILGVWNLVNANTEKKNLAFFKENPNEIYNYYEPRSTVLIVTLCINLVFGALIGCIAMIYELNLRSYIILHKDSLHL